MATIALYAGKINQMPGLIRAAKQSVETFKSELSSLQKKASKVDSGVCDLSEVISSIQASTQTQENRIESLEQFRTKSDDFINDTVSIDNKVAETVNQNKEDFYDKYDYLKPDCEKSGWEKFCDACKAVGEWCKEHWVEICIGLVCIAIGAVLTALTGGAGSVFLATFLNAFLGGLKFAAVSALVTGGLNVLYYAAGTLMTGGKLDIKDSIRTFGDGLASGFMTGGIFAGVSMGASAWFRFRAMNGVRGGPSYNLQNGIRHYPDTLQNGSPSPGSGGTIWNWANSRNAPGLRFDVDTRILKKAFLPNYFHFHLDRLVGPTKTIPALAIFHGHIRVGLYASVGIGSWISNSGWYSTFKKWQREKWRQLFGN